MSNENTEIQKMKENQNIIETRTIAELLTLHFSIPTYQRGYRWDISQVNALLNDIDDYVIDHKNTEAFYCLQPVVVIENDNNELQLIDGQQRLTTILLILRFLNDTEFRTPKPIYSISFEARTQQKNFEDVVQDESICNKDIDLYHLHKAYLAIKLWFETLQVNNPSIGGEFYSKLINKVRVIWYEIKDGSDVIDIFTRLNIGKIPLTNAELIKALFLIKSNFEEQSSLRQLQIATEWDTIEKKLQDDSFWFFIYSPEHSSYYENRIEYLFDLIQDKKAENEEYHTFNCFNSQLKESKNKLGTVDIDKHWLRVKEYFLTLEEWYQDQELYHLIGFLIEYKANIDELKKKSKELTKPDFKLYLRTKIKKGLTDVVLNELEYGTPAENKLIKRILLLFNIETILKTQKATMRFPFDKYKDEKWDIEHVTSRTDKKITDENAWCKDILLLLAGEEYFNDEISEEHPTKTNKEIVQFKINHLANAEEVLIAQQIVKFIETEKFDAEQFNTIFESVTKYYGENDLEEKHNIGNLALLDQYTNRGYGNAIFPIKRKEIMKNDSTGVFVPIATKNLFLKYYSTQLNGMRWSKQDSLDYLSKMESILSPYLNDNKKNNEQ